MMLFGKTPFREYTDMSMKDVNEWQRKYEKKMTIITVALMVVLVLVVVTKSSIYGGKIDAAKKIAQQMKEKNIKIAVLTKGASGFIHDYFAGIRQEIEPMGITVDTFSANHDLVNFHNLLVQVKKQNYDGIIVSQIKTDDLKIVDDIRKISNKGIPIVAFNSQLPKIKGITVANQNHVRMTELALADMYQKLNGKGNIIYLWMDDYPELMIRHKNYEQFLKVNSNIKEIDRFGVSAPDPTVPVNEAITKMLEKYGKGKIDAIFSVREAFARGAAQAIKHANRNEIKVYSVGSVSNYDLQIMQKKNSPWVSITGVDSREMGAIGARLLLKKIAGEETPAEYEFKPSLITQDELRSVKGAVNTESLKKVIRGWGENNDFKEDWMEELKESHTCKSINTAN